MSYSELTDAAKDSDYRDEIDAAVTAFNDSWGGEAGFTASVTGSVAADNLKIEVTHDNLGVFGQPALFTYDGFTAWSTCIEGVAA